MKKILVPIDFTEEAQMGANLAEQVARRSGSELHLVNFLPHAPPDSFNALGDTTIKSHPQEDLFTIQLIRVNQGKLEAMADKLKGAGLNAAGEVYDGEFEEGSVEFIENHDVELVIMGTTGLENMTEKFTGNHTEKLINAANCPVISVKTAADISKFNHIVLAVDPADGPLLTVAFRHLMQFVSLFKSTVHFVFVKEESDSANRDLEAMAKSYGIHNYTMETLHGKDSTQLVINHAHKLNAGMIAVFKNSHSGMMHVFSKSFSEKLVLESDLPVFTFNIKNA